MQYTRIENTDRVQVTKEVVEEVDLNWVKEEIQLLKNQVASCTAEIAKKEALLNEITTAIPALKEKVVDVKPVIEEAII